MKQKYLTPTAVQIPMLIEQTICTGSNVITGGDYDIFPDDFDSDSD
jgi:hypothetical protein